MTKKVQADRLAAVVSTGGEFIENDYKLKGSG